MISYYCVGLVTTAFAEELVAIVAANLWDLVLAVGAQHFLVIISMGDTKDALAGL